MESKVREYLAEIGRRGGLKSRRVLAPETARAMVRVREARRVYRRFHSKCFWSFDPDYRIEPTDIAWVVEQLRKHGDRAAWEAAEKLCR
jgi:ribosomal protein L24E